MPIANLKNAAVLFLGTVALFPSFHPGGNRGATQNAAPTVVQVDKAPPVPRPRPTCSML
jgi:hypothetical protein